MDKNVESVSPRPSSITDAFFKFLFDNPWLSEIVTYLRIIQM